MVGFREAKLFRLVDGFVFVSTFVQHFITTIYILHVNTTLQSNYDLGAEDLTKAKYL